MAGGALSFREDPFRLTPDRRYIFETDGFRRAFAMLLAGVRARRGAMLLTGPSGTGKTTLLQGLLAKLQQEGAVVFWRFHPDIPGYDLVGSCLAELEIEDAPTDPAARARALTTALKARSAAQPAVLIVDEAGQFADAQLAELGTLAAATGGAVQVILAGLPTLIERLAGGSLAELGRAMALRAELGPLARSELGAYIAHRCRVAGQAGPLVFEPTAIARVFDHTGGVPRLVNRLCATALFFADPGSKQVSAAVVDEAAQACANEDAAPTRAEVPTAVEPEPTTATEPPPEAPQRPERREAPSEVHRTLAEAERAWIAGGTAPQSAEAPASPPAADWHVAEAAAETGEDHTPAEFERPSAEVSEPAPVRRRSPALRIAASVVIVAGAAVAAGVILWPGSTNHERQTDSQPAQLTTRLLVAEAVSTKPDPQPSAPAAEAPQLAPTGTPVIAAVIPVAPASAPAEATPIPVAVATVPAEPAPTAVPTLPADTMVRADEPRAEDPAPALPNTLSAIEPASGRVPEPDPEPAPVAEAAASPTPAPAEPPKSEPAPVVAAAPIPPSASPTPALAAAPAPKPPAAPAVAAVVPTEPPPAPARAAQASLAPADAAELQRLMVRGDEMLRLGDPASARLFYERAAARGLPRAYTAVGQTYDPALLQRLGIRGGGANGEQALAWYRRGAEAGDDAAPRALSELSAWLARSR